MACIESLQGFLLDTKAREFHSSTVPLGLWAEAFVEPVRQAARRADVQWDSSQPSHWSACNPSVPWKVEIVVPGFRA